jgi:hypothetical protein
MGFGERRRIKTMLLAAAVTELLLFGLASIQLLAAADVTLYTISYGLVVCDRFCIFI